MENCIHCGIELTNENWYPSCQKKDYRSCKNCQSLRSKKYYQENKERINQNSKERYKLMKKNPILLARRNELARKRYRLRGDSNKANEYRKSQYERLFEALGNKCGICGFDDSRALQIHHRSGRPSDEGKQKMLNLNYPIEKLQLLCANCHKIIHH